MTELTKQIKVANYDIYYIARRYPDEVIKQKEVS